MAAQWTFLVYLLADSNLSAEASACIAKIRALAPTDSVNVLVQAKIPGTGGTNVNRYVVSTAPQATPAVVAADVGSTAALEEFLAWASTYPAERTALIFSGHGWGVEPGPHVHAGIIRDDVIYDLTSLTIQQIRQTIQSPTVAQDWPSGKVDLIGFDACLMGMVEVAYEVAGISTAMVASECLSPGQGWPYDAMLTSLFESPAMDAVALAKAIVSSFQTYYAANEADVGYAQLAAIQLQAGQVGQVYSALDGLGGALDALVLNPAKSQMAISQIAQACNQATAMVTADSRGLREGDADYIDLRTFIDGLGGLVPTQSAQVREALQAAVVDPFAQASSNGPMYGLSILFPTDPAALSIYSSLAFGNNAWVKLLHDFFDQGGGDGLAKFRKDGGTGPVIMAKQQAPMRRPHVERVHRRGVKRRHA